METKRQNQGGVTQRHQRLASWPGTLTSKKTYIHTTFDKGHWCAAAAAAAAAVAAAVAVLVFRHGLRTPDEAFFQQSSKFLGQLDRSAE